MRCFLSSNIFQHNNGEVVVAMQNEIENINQALEEHLGAINDNSLEIQSLFDYMREIEVKMDKISHRLDQLQLASDKTPEKISVMPLDKTEMRIFLTFYTEEHPLTFQEIAQKVNLPYTMIPDCLSALTQKGIPLQRSYFKNQLFIKLDPQFKEMQAKENIVNLSLSSFME